MTVDGIVPQGHAKAFAVSHGLSGIVLVGISPNGEVCAASWGRTGEQCREMEEINKSFHHQVTSGFYLLGSFPGAPGR